MPTKFLHLAFLFTQAHHQLAVIRLDIVLEAVHPVDVSLQFTASHQNILLLDCLCLNSCFRSDDKHLAGLGREVDKCA